MACHHRLWAAHTVERRQAWHAIIAFGKHTRSNDIERGMTPLPLDNTHGRQRRAWHDITALGLHTRSATLGVTCHHRLWTAHTVERRGAWHAIIAFGQHTRSNDVRRYMPSPLLESTHRQTTLGVVLPSSPYGSTHGPTPSGVACQHRLWAAQTVNRRQALHEITALRLHA